MFGDIHYRPGRGPAGRGGMAARAISIPARLHCLENGARPAPHLQEKTCQSHGAISTAAMMMENMGFSKNRSDQSAVLADRAASRRPISDIAGAWDKAKAAGRG